MSHKRLVIVALLLVATGSARGAQVMKKVWFPDGVITWRTSKFNSGLRPGVGDAMDYFEQRTPLRITEDQAKGALEIRLADGIFKGWYGGETKGYRNAEKNQPLIRLSSKYATSATWVRNTLTHEFGHALGFTHEFQRPDRRESGIRIETVQDPFNFDIVHDDAIMLTPYDFESQFATGYEGVVPEPTGPFGALLSAWDIDSIYRVYARPLDSGVAASDRFGVAVTSGDYDGDDMDDVAVASVEPDGGVYNVFLNFFKGVVTGPDDEDGQDTGVSYMPWFRTYVATVTAEDQDVSLASGDLKKRASSTTVTAGRDGIDEVVIGMPSALDGEGLVQILTVNVEDRFLPHDHPWGGKGIFATTSIRPKDAGVPEAYRHGFGRALLVANLSGGESDDLVIGAPNTAPAPLSAFFEAGLVAYLPGGNTTNPVVMRNPSGEMTSHYGATLGVIPQLWENPGKTKPFAVQTLDALVVGAPGEDREGEHNTGAVYIYKMAVDANNVPLAPAFSRKIMEPGKGMHFGHALLGFLTNEGGFSWFPKFHLIVGSPEHEFLKDLGGSVWLYDIGEGGTATRVGVRNMPGAEQGADFGASLAVSRANCRPTHECSSRYATVAIGAPHASVSGVQAGHVYTWAPWERDPEAAESIPVKMASGTLNSEYGLRLAPIRQTETNGGFVIGAPDLSIAIGGGNVPAGGAPVHLNKTLGKWSSWIRLLSGATGADQPPKNR